MVTSFHWNQTISHRNPSREIFLSNVRVGLGKISPDSLPVTQNSNESASPFLVSLLTVTLSRVLSKKLSKFKKVSLAIRVITLIV